ncbi:MAG: hypothetical protein JWN48_3871 [Myxococcaceae bacterium]|nr:hypothetical protein [Myxococcaceae bacterium]
MRWARSLLGLSITLAAACGEALPDKPLLNRCTQGFECARGEKCDQPLGLCAREKFERPYSLILLAVPRESELTRKTTDSMVLNESGNVGAIKVRRAVPVRGSVFDSLGTALSAEVAFSPKESGFLAGGVSAFTLPLVERDAGVSSNTYAFSAQLLPDTSYDVRVFPLGSDSERLPPRSFELPKPEPAELTTFVYPPLTQRRATVLDENKAAPRAGSKLRLRHKVSQQYVSSIGKPEPKTGKFDLEAPDEVWNALSDHELVLEIPFGDAPQTVEIVFLATLLQPEAVLVMPVVPPAIRHIFRVEDKADSRRPIDAEMTFVSSFELPTGSGYQSGLDWCRLKLPGSMRGTLTCNTQAQATATRSVGSANLLPGTYRLFLSPRGDSVEARSLATTARPATISEQADGGPQEGQLYQLEPAVVYGGSVSNLAGQPMPAVTVTANALGVVQDLPEVSRYNRTVEQTSDRYGNFQLAVDTGYYDLVATPPAGSGYAWVVNYNRAINAGRTDAGAFPVVPRTPVIVRGVVQTESSPDGGAGSPLDEARVEAYAIVPQLETGARRAVRLAITETDERGVFALSLPPFIGEDPRPSETGDGGTIMQQVGQASVDLDAGRDLDAGL